MEKRTISSLDRERKALVKVIIEESLNPDATKYNAAVRRLTEVNESIDSQMVGEGDPGEPKCEFACEVCNEDAENEDDLIECGNKFMCKSCIEKAQEAAEAAAEDYDEPDESAEEIAMRRADDQYDAMREGDIHG